ncbi:MAG: GDSL family lipase [Lachnospiraceae bacterium]|nr:GDSL family lipase [Lachnospiraceae bacterium]
MFDNEITITNENLVRYELKDIENLRVYGRYSGDVYPLNLFWTASGIEFRVKAGEVWIEVESSYNIYEPWVSTTVDGAFNSRTMLPKGRYFIPVIRNMTKENEKTIRLFKDVQAMSSDDEHGLKIWSILTDGEFVPLPEKKLKLEFIGDSITSGEGVIGAHDEWDWISMFFDSVHEYATITADMLDADYHIVSQSGWGVLTGWDNNPDCSIPDHYSKLCGVVWGDNNHKMGSDKPYDFSKWSADVIVVNLGTNDGGAFNSPEYVDPVSGRITKQRLNEDGTFVEEDVRKFIDKCKLFLAELRYHNPNSKILWAYGMLGTFMEEPIVKAIDEYKAASEDYEVYYVRLPETNDETVGSRAHPGPKNHEEAAKVLVKKIKELV